MADKKIKKKIVTVKELKKQLKDIPDDWEVLVRDESGEKLKNVDIVVRHDGEKSLGCLFG